MRSRHARAVSVSWLLLLGVAAGLSSGAACSPVRPPGAEIDGDLPIPTTTPGSTAPPAPKGPAPTFGETRHLDDAPPPISGGTLFVTSSKAYAIASDPDRDHVFVTTLGTRTTVAIPTARHAEPGRAAEDALGNVHVVLRKTGEVMSLDPRTATVLSTRKVCGSPRGITYDAPRGSLLVVCAGGEVVRVPADPATAPMTIARHERDLRDVVLSGGKLYVSTFRSARIFEIAETGERVRGLHVPGEVGVVRGTQPAVAWRMIAGPGGNGEPYVVHQLASSATIPTEPRPGAPSPYGSGSRDPNDNACGEAANPIVASAVTRPTNGEPGRRTNGIAPLPVDLATDGKTITFLAAGNGHTPERPQLFSYDASLSGGPKSGARDPRFDSPLEQRCNVRVEGSAADVGQLVALAYAGEGQLVLQSREPAQLVLWPSRVVIPLASDSREDTGHAVFHANSSADITCASCHAEGTDDGHTWTFERMGDRRTPSLLGTLEGTAPYHWDGDMADVSGLMDTVFSKRMAGPVLDGDQKDVLQKWLFALPAPKAETTSDEAAVARGKALFEGARTGCVSCHSGPRFTTNVTANVGTGAAFQAPSLVGVAWRAPFLHDGCAKTLLDRFLSCGSEMHGTTSSLSRAELNDLVGYLESL